MGCQITSVYADQVLGKICYPQSIRQQILKRDYCINNKINDQIYTTSGNNLIQSIYGISHSFCQSFIFCTIFDHNQHLVYNNGRFIIKILINQLKQLQNNKLPKLNILTHDDKIIVMDVNQNLCSVGILGGELYVWDLRFNQIKIKIILPKQSLSFTSLSLNKKYVFVTDNSSPNNKAYCYDLQTTKLNAATIIKSEEPTFKGIGFMQNHHVTVCGQGVFFMNYSQKDKILISTKAMFKKTLKTGQLCLANLQNKYIVTGGINGFIYFWTKSYECIKSIQISNAQIFTISFIRNYKQFIVSDFEYKTKYYSIDVKQKINEEYQDQIIQETTCAMIECYEQQSYIVNIVNSKEEKLLYFKVSSIGRLSSHLLPTNEPYSKRLKQFDNKQLLRWSNKGQIVIKQSQKLNSFSLSNKKVISIQNIYPLNQTIFNRDIYILCENLKWWQLIQTKMYIVQKYSCKKIFSYCDFYESLAFLNNKRIKTTFENKINEQQLAKNKDNLSLNLKKTQPLKNQKYRQKQFLQIHCLQQSEELFGLNYLQVKNEQYLIYLFITTIDKCYIYRIKSSDEYSLQRTVRFVPKKFNNIVIQTQQQQKQDKNMSFQVCFDQNRKQWKLVNHQQNKQFFKQEVLNKFHLDFIKSSFHKNNIYDKKQSLKISVGGNSIIHWK